MYACVCFYVCSCLYVCVHVFSEKESVTDPGPFQFGYTGLPVTLRHLPVSLSPVLRLKDCKMPEFCVGARELEIKQHILNPLSHLLRT